MSENTNAAQLERMKELHGILREASRAYYAEDREIMSNFEYDRLYDELQSLEEETGVHIPSFGHAGDGNLHIYLCRGDLGDEAWAKAKEDIFALLYARAVELGGLVSGEHGIGLDKKKYLRESAGERQIALMKGIKAVFDPNNILNPQKVID